MLKVSADYKCVRALYTVLKGYDHDMSTDPTQFLIKCCNYFNTKNNFINPYLLRTNIIKSVRSLLGMGVFWMGVFWVGVFWAAFTKRLHFLNIDFLINEVPR
jgi:hypothetical protein